MTVFLVDPMSEEQLKAFLEKAKGDSTLIDSISD